MTLIKVFFFKKGKKIVKDCEVLDINDNTMICCLLSLVLLTWNQKKPFGGEKFGQFFEVWTLRNKHVCSQPCESVCLCLCALCVSSVFIPLLPRLFCLFSKVPCSPQFSISWMETKVFSSLLSLWSSCLDTLHCSETNTRSKTIMSVVLKTNYMISLTTCLTTSCFLKDQRVVVLSKL